MTDKLKITELKKYLCAEELRLAMRCDVLLADCLVHRTPSAAVAYFEAVISWKQFVRVMHAVDDLLHLFSGS